LAAFFLQSKAAEASRFHPHTLTPTYLVTVAGKQQAPTHIKQQQRQQSVVIIIMASTNNTKSCTAKAAAAASPEQKQTSTPSTTTTEQQQQQQPFVVVVTGANQGIGYETVAQLYAALAKQKKQGGGVRESVIVLCARDAKKGDTARTALLKAAAAADAKATTTTTTTEATPAAAKIVVQQLDLLDLKSIAAAAAALKQQYKHVDVLINNAGMAWKGDAFDEKVARTTIAVNHYGTHNVTKAMLPLFPTQGGGGGRIVNVSSMSGTSALNKMSAALRKRFMSAELTATQLDALAEQFIADVKAKQWTQKGWPSTCYGVSKALLHAQTRVLAAELAAKKIAVNACCPGWCKTNMAGFTKPPRTAAQGAETSVFLALGDGATIGTGKFWSDKKSKPFCDNNSTDNE
jgi:carbonyl reductase 1